MVLALCQALQLPLLLELELELPLVPLAER